MPSHLSPVEGRPAGPRRTGGLWGPTGSSRRRSATASLSFSIQSKDFAQPGHFDDPADQGCLVEHLDGTEVVGDADQQGETRAVRELQVEQVQLDLLRGALQELIDLGAEAIDAQDVELTRD